MSQEEIRGVNGERRTGAGIEVVDDTLVRRTVRAREGHEARRRDRAAGAGDLELDAARVDCTRSVNVCGHG